MIDFLALISWLFIAAGLFFFTSGSVGLVRFPDVYSRLHAVTKADTLGLGLLIAGLACRAPSLRLVALLVLVWLLVLASGAVNCQLLARFSRDSKAASDPVSYEDNNG